MFSENYRRIGNSRLSIKALAKGMVPLLVVLIFSTALLQYYVSNSTAYNLNSLSFLQSDDFETGYINGRPEQGDLFYWLFRSQQSPENDPLVIWLQGGPGSSSEIGVFFEHGPWQFDAHGNLERREYSWNRIANMLYIDQPAGVGLSREASEVYACHTSECGAQRLLWFLLGFYDKYPEFRDRDLYIMGESYGGHYVSTFAHRVFSYNVDADSPISLRGFAVGNGIINMKWQFDSFAEYAIGRNLITEEQLPELLMLEQKIFEQEQTIGINAAAYSILGSEILRDGEINMYDVTVKGDYDWSNLNRFMNDPKIRKILGGDATKKYDGLSEETVYFNFMPDYWLNVDPQISQMLDNSDIKALIYCGMNDFICNCVGQRNWITKMPWSGQALYNAKTAVPFITNGKVHGTSKTAKNFQYVEIADAGHMLPMNQPEAAFKMFSLFISQS